jgi:hypothetical protein
MKKYGKRGGENMKSCPNSDFDPAIRLYDLYL